MQILVQMQSGRKLSIEVARTDTVEDLRAKIYEQDAEAHPGLQLLALAEGGRVLEDGHTMAEYGLHKESELRLGVRPLTEAIALNVSGVEQITTLETLLSAPRGSKLLHRWMRQRHRTQANCPRSRDKKHQRFLW